ncbi:MAG: DUF3127 domain-containing protein [Verrucomicrobia bacterium]|nr:DUF3127 domain-containing protein [Verrucomicrobiota bacterium]
MDLQTFPSGFTKREFVVTTDERFPQDIKLDLLKEKTDLVNGYKVGDAVTVQFDLRGREYNGRYYNDLTAWKIERGAGSSSAEDGAPDWVPDELPDNEPKGEPPF